MHQTASRATHRRRALLGVPLRGTLVTLALLAALAITSIVPAHAGTTGVITGTVTEAGTHRPLGDVHVSAVSPTGRYFAVTDAHGFFAITGVQPDSYIISYSLTGYDPRVVEGLAVFADATATANVQLQKSLQTIAHVTSHSFGSAFQPDKTADTYTVNAAQIKDIQGNAFNTSENSLLEALPGVVPTNDGQIAIRGGGEFTVGYQLEGMDYSNAFFGGNITAGQLPGLALSEVQVTPGVADASYGGTGSGTVNIIDKRGTYPGFSTLQAAVGGPHFFHSFQGEYGTATSNERWSEYASFTGSDLAPIYAGGEYPTDEIDLSSRPGERLETDRDFTNNLIYHFGQNNKYALQLFVDLGADETDFGPGGYEPGECLATCSPDALYWAQDELGIENYQQLDQLLGPFPGQTNFNETVEQYGAPPGGSYFYQNKGLKAEFDDNISPSTYLSLKASHVFATYDQTYWYEWDNGSHNYISSVGELSADLTKQLNAQNLLKAGVSQTHTWPDIDDLLPDYPAELLYDSYPAQVYDFMSPDDTGCRLGDAPDGTSYCGYLYSQMPNGPGPVIAGSATNYLHPTQDAYYITDTFSPGDGRLNVDAGLRFDSAHYDVPAPGVNLANCSTEFYPSTWTMPTPSAENPYGLVIPGQFCPTATFNITSAETDPTIAQPRLAASFRLDPNDAVRASFGRSVQFERNIEGDDNGIPLNTGNGFSNMAPFFNPGEYCYFYGYYDDDPSCQNPNNASGSYYPANQDVGYYNYANPFPCGGPAGSGTPACAQLAATPNGLDPNWPNPPNGVKNPAGPPFTCGNAGFTVPCTSYQQELYWSLVQTWGGIPIQLALPSTYNNFDFSYQHQFTHGFLRDVSFSITPWWRTGYDLSADTESPLTRNGQIVRNPDGSIEFGPYLLQSVGALRANGWEFRVARMEPYGLSVQLSATNQHVLTSVPDAAGTYYAGSVEPASLAIGALYPDPTDSPFSSVLDVSYHTHGGWRVATQLYYNDGFPIGAGEMAATYIHGQPVVVPNTNATGLGITPSKYVDPGDPGTMLDPNVVATNGTPEGEWANGILSHSDLEGAVTLEKDISNRITLGVSVDNIFNEIYTTSTSTFFYNGGPILNSEYQPVATGVGGALSGQNPNAYIEPGVYYNLPAQFHGADPYYDLPTGEGRTWYFYVTIRNI